MNTTQDTPTSSAPAPAARAVRPRGARVAGTAAFLEKLGLGYFAPIVRLAGRDEPARQVREIVINTILPLLAFVVFMVGWMAASKHIRTDSTKIPSPTETWHAWEGIRSFAEGETEKRGEFNRRMGKLAAQWRKNASEASTPKEKAQMLERAELFAGREYVGPPTFYDQIWTSLFTVSIGFGIATLIAVPLGIFCGLSKGVNTALNPLIQIFKPVSPLAWLPIVFVIVTALYTPAEGDHLWTRAMFISAGTVTLCSLWPTLVNTAVGVAAIDPDHMNVARVLRLSWWQRIRKIVLPSALPLMFTGMRLSLGVGWMVLIAADMLAQNPGLGKFVWDTFQNGSTNSMAEIVCAVFVIGLIGFVLDRVMFALQKLVSFDDKGI